MPGVVNATIDRKTENDWQGEHIARFWDWCSRSARRQRSYFTALAGDGISGFLERQGPVRGRLLDFGCGTGHLLELLLRKHSQLEGHGLEFSPESAAAVERRLSGTPNWRGVALADELPAPFPDDYFQLITFIETIEHLKEDALHASLRELHRMLAPSGRLLITTPFEEDLEANMIYCPFCRSEFHRMQHMRSFSTASLCGLLGKFGFHVQFCRNVNLCHYGTLSGRLLLGAKDRARQWLKLLLGRPAVPPPHLVAVVSK